MSISEKPTAPIERAPDGRSRRPILQGPGRLVVYMGLVLLTALFLFGMAFAMTEFSAMDLLTFVAFVAGAAICVEGSRRLGVPTPAGFNRDLLGAWWFPVVLLLPPLYSLIIPIPVYLLLQQRTRQTLVHRRVFTAASVGLSSFLVSVTWYSVWSGSLVGGLRGDAKAVEALASGPGVVVALLCCAGFTVLNTLIVAGAARISNPSRHGMRPLWDREAVTVDCVELCVGVTIAILAHLSLYLLVIAVPPVLLLQRSLLYQQLQMAVRTDPKTGLLNAPTWEQEASVEIARARSTRGRAAVLIVDIDHFKRVNDTHGHLFGDQVLLGVATTIAQQLRQSDLLGRFGGEEFVVLLPGSDTGEAWQAAERLRSQVGSMEITVDNVPVSVTISVGVAVVGEHGNDLVELLTAADLALYRAKETGRNRVCMPAGRTAPEGRIPGSRSGGEVDPPSGS
ncbi:GGDEF domain-containing protein [Nocardiopsis algeriensis]|uniref:sensor domain-containing diguanylate cyclase n=1 Tax=Nocardiopsis algeriensis TaxID=1478215 RepID=UPI003B42CFBF